MGRGEVRIAIIDRIHGKKGHRNQEMFDGKEKGEKPRAREKTFSVDSIWEL